MVAELKPNVSPLILEAVSLRAQGLSYGDVARNMGHSDVKAFTSLVRRTCMEELGIPTFYGTAAWLIRESLLDPLELTKGRNLVPLARLTSVDQVGFSTLVSNPHADPKDKFVMRMDRDFGAKKDLKPAIAQTGARNMTELVVLNAAFLETPPDALMRMQIMRLPEVKKTREPRKKGPRKKQVPRQLSPLQSEIIKLDAQGISKKEIALRLKLSLHQSYRQTLAAHKVLKLRSGTLPKEEAKEAAASRQIHAAKSLVEQGVLDPIEIASLTFTDPSHLIGTFQSLGSREMKVLELLAQGKTIPEMAEDMRTTDFKYAKKTNNLSISDTLWLISKSVKSGTRTHLVMLYQAYCQTIQKSKTT